MKQVVILSGKGGTGKTSLTAALAHAAAGSFPLVMADADVDASNLEILLDPKKNEEHDFIGGFKASIDEKACTGCGRCFEICRFDAVIPPADKNGSYSIDPLACEGCNSCVHQCPAEAVESHRVVAGVWFESDSAYGPLFHAEMKAGEENSGKLVTAVKNAAIGKAQSITDSLLLVDGPPGIGCPVIAACAGADLALISTEPGVSAIHDLERIYSTVDHFGVPAVVVVNRSDINAENAARIRDFCEFSGIPLAGMIPYDARVTESMARGKPVNACHPDSSASVAVASIWRNLLSILSAI